MRRSIFIKTINIFLIISSSLQAQNTLTLQNCYDLLKSNYPLAKQSELVAQSNKLNLESINSNYLPQLYLNAQATYQSAVTSIPIKIPNLNIPELNKDQYRGTIDVNQLIFDGGTTKESAKIQNTVSQIQQQQINNTIYQQKLQLNQVFFSILLLKEKWDLLQSVKENLESRFKEIHAVVVNEMLIAASEQVIAAELIKTKQQIAENEYDRKAGLDMLSLLIGKELNSKTILEKPILTDPLNEDIERPEIQLFELQKQEWEDRSKLSRTKRFPKLSAFVQGGYGNPGLNMLDNSFQPFYIGGLRLNWNIWDWRNTRNQQQIFNINKMTIDVQRENFELNTYITLRQIDSETRKITESIKADEEIIALRKKILQSTEALLKNGSITSSQYITELSALNQAEISKKNHEIQLQLAKANYLITKGSTDK